MDAYEEKLRNSLYLEKEYFAEAEKWYEIDRDKLLSSYDIKLDKNGVIRNYREIAETLDEATLQDF
mgnify:CR=1 FL=1